MKHLLCLVENVARIENRGIPTISVTAHQKWWENVFQLKTWQTHDCKNEDLFFLKMMERYSQYVWLFTAVVEVSDVFLREREKKMKDCYSVSIHLFSLYIKKPEWKHQKFQIRWYTDESKMWWRVPCKQI